MERPTISSGASRIRTGIGGLGSAAYNGGSVAYNGGVATKNIISGVYEVGSTAYQRTRNAIQQNLRFPYRESTPEDLYYVTFNKIQQSINWADQDSIYIDIHFNSVEFKYTYGKLNMSLTPFFCVIPMINPDSIFITVFENYTFTGIKYQNEGQNSGSWDLDMPNTTPRFYNQSTLLDNLPTIFNQSVISTDEMLQGISNGMITTDKINDDTIKIGPYTSRRLDHLGTNTVLTAEGDQFTFFGNKFEFVHTLIYDINQEQVDDEFMKIDYQKGFGARRTRRKSKARKSRARKRSRRARSKKYRK
jgi:hypothetical protein